MRDWYKKRRIMKRYDMTATMYDMRYEKEQAAKITAALKNMKIERNELILDVGCGTGILFRQVADESNLIVGIDFSRITLLQAKERVRTNNVFNVEMIQADADNMPFNRDLFDRVFAITILQNTPNPGDTLAEIKRVSKKEALFVITGLKKIFTKQAFEQLLRNCRLNVSTLEDENLKCFVAICTN
jgi:ubiquinone/menaquinone biosynthesis C-methylase UbiE